MKVGDKRGLRSQWVSFLFLTPFAFLLVVHEIYDFSDAVMVQAEAGKTDAMMLNILMILSFFVGVSGFLVHTLLFRSASKKWLIAKLTFLVVAWGCIIAFC